MNPNEPRPEQPAFSIPDANPPQQMTPMTAEERNAPYLKDNPLAAMQEDEEIIADIRRHPFGIVSLYIFSFVGLAGACGVILLLVPRLLNSSSSSTNPALISVSLIGILVLCMLVGLAITTTVYWQNRWIVTSDSITQITQRGIFARQVSQLSFANLEDVTAEQRGLVPNMLNFGTLKVETAGEHSKFYFLYCPDPNLYARKILMARELYIRSGNRNFS